ncbi:hypothetical protein [Burkholderia thailandensis]|uniref:hypothetical protein n=2 Tax=Burkholderia thailandensis TaxID=57975 RepID=UPI0009B65631|nr:hypothetical protein [Burkholderia thailandensis]
MRMKRAGDVNGKPKVESTMTLSSCHSRRPLFVRRRLAPRATRIVRGARHADHRRKTRGAPVAGSLRRLRDACSRERRTLARAGRYRLIGL